MTLKSRILLTLLAASTMIGVASADPPLAPTIIWPPAGAMVGSNRPDILWTGSGHDAYEVHVGWFNSPSSSEGWDSGIVPGTQPVPGVETGPLEPAHSYYVFLRLHNANGWGPWSAANRHFHVGGEWLGNAYLVTDQPGLQRDHAITFNPDRNEYLVSFMNIQAPGEPIPFVGAWILNSAGQRLPGRGLIEIHNGMDGAGATVCTYNNDRAEYLVVDRDYRAHLYGQRIDAATGTLAGGSFGVHTANATLEHAVAYASGSDVYLEAWRDDGNGACHAVLGRRFRGSDGALLGGVIPIVADIGNCVGGPQIGYNLNANPDEFLVVYQMVVNDQHQDLYCRRVSAATGQLLGAGPVLLAGTAATEWHCGIVFDAEMDRYLLAYEILGGNPSIWGRFVAADGQPAGPAFVIAGAPFNGGPVGLTWNPTSREYLVTWGHAVSEANYARRVSQTGSLVGEPFRTNGHITGFGNFAPLPQANPINGDYLICWQNNHAKVHVRRYKPHAGPQPDAAAPPPVTNLTLMRLPGAIKLRWMNPPTQDDEGNLSDFMGTTIRARTDAYPTAATDGNLVADVPNAPGIMDSARHTGLVKGMTYYFAAFAHDRVPLYAPSAVAHTTLWPGDFDGDADIDQSDYAHLQTCLAGDSRRYDEGCEDTDLDEDGDVDVIDFNEFFNCFDGANVSPDC